MLKKILKYTGISLLVLIALAFLLPILFKGKIIALIKKEINKSVNARVDFKDADISMFRHFPKLSIGLNELQVIGVNEFANDTLIAAKHMDVAINLISAIKGKDIKIYNIQLQEPRIHAIVNKLGDANWNIVKPDTVTVKSNTSTAAFKLNLEKYGIHKGYVSYVDETSNMIAEVNNIEHSGSGDFTKEQFTLATKTIADDIYFSYSGIPYLNKTKASINADLQIDAKASKYSFTTDNIKLNELLLSSSGFFQLMSDGGYNMDIQFKAPSTEFKNILSFVPAIYQNNFSSITTKGQAVFNGFVKGIYNSQQIPAYTLNLTVKDGFFQYPDLPKPVKNVNLAVQVNNPDGITDHTVVNISQAHLEMAEEPFDFKLLIKNPISDLYVDGAAKGKLDLSKITQFVKLQADTKLSGLLNADVSVKGKANAIQQQRYNEFAASGTIGLNNFLYASKDYPAGVQLANLFMTFNPKNVTLNNAAGKFMNTNFTANGYINNLLPYLFSNKALNGSLTAKADNLNLNEWMGVSTDTANKNMASAKPFVVPANLDLTLNASIDKVHYDKLDIANVIGSLLIADETIKLNNVKGNALDGTMSIGGYYSTKNSKLKPDIALTYDVKNLDIQKTFLAFNTVQKLMPIGQFLAGKLSSQLSMNGKLGNNMMPDLNTLTGNGNVLMLEGVLAKFQPMDKIANTLNVQALQNISAKDVKTFFEFANGNVLVKPFNVKVKGIDMEIGGLHGLTQNMDYTINMKVPRAMMGDKANNVISSLTAQAANKGVAINVNDIVPIQVKLGGNIKSPTIKTDLKQTATSLAQDISKQATDFAKAKADSAKAAIRDTVNAAKKALFQSAKDELAKKLLAQKDSTTNNSNDPKKTLEEKGKGLLKNLNPFKKKVVDTTQH
jgi:hypothetical protein